MELMLVREGMFEWQLREGRVLGRGRVVEEEGIVEVGLLLVVTAFGKLHCSCYLNYNNPQIALCDR